MGAQDGGGGEDVAHSFLVLHGQSLALCSYVQRKGNEEGKKRKRNRVYKDTIREREREGRTVFGSPA